MASIAAIETEKAQYQEQVDLVAAQLRDDPENSDLIALQEELSNLITLLDENIAELRSKRPEKINKSAVAETPQPEIWSRENHPAFKKASAQEEKEEPPANYQVNDTVMAKWLSGDKAFYPARITSITGSSTAPIYTVRFKSYDTVESLRSRDIRPATNKRKTDASTTTTTTTSASSLATTTPTTAPTAAPGLVSSAGATMYAEAQTEAHSKETDAAQPPKPKKLRAKKELEASKSKWQEFNSKSKVGKSLKKDSMFRTPDGIRGRVGFTGSGQAMRKDPARIRPHHPEEDVD
ncbi:hypothetical protein CDD82_3337 [Ophiocordyceps australis]|uniref:DNA repair protein Crb2 Tudor domain-containing protein n=1 Tax=Ophiocordyceps australis TaxID=1399860 RepID=A0A2C5ZDH7_9HYPO|nr:hypothetical protein CDD82_3337 [Ophiocordyceps australis]